MAEEIRDWCSCGPRGWDWHPWVQGSCETDQPQERGGVVPITPIYSAALDEIYRLRTLLAWEADVLAATAGYRSFPKSRQEIAQQSIARMRAAARGEAAAQVLAESNTAVRYARDEAGMAQLMTRAQWEEQRFSHEDWVRPSGPRRSA